LIYITLTVKHLPSNESQFAHYKRLQNYEVFKKVPNKLLIFF